MQNGIKMSKHHTPKLVNAHTSRNGRCNRPVCSQIYRCGPSLMIYRRNRYYITAILDDNAVSRVTEIKDIHSCSGGRRGYIYQKWQGRIRHVIQFVLCIQKPKRHDIRKIRGGISIERL